MNIYKDNRELSWLKFNDRVLMQAKDENVPLGERLTFISIFQTNQMNSLEYVWDSYLIRLCFILL